METGELKIRINEFLKDNNIELCELSGAIDSIQSEEIFEKAKNHIRDNKDLVGRCFVRNSVNINGRNLPKIYYKVISARSENEYRVECLEFKEHPNTRFNKRLRMAFSSCDKLFGSFGHTFFYIESEMAKDIRKYSEISEEEFRNVAQQFFNELMDSKWEIKDGIEI